MGFRLVIINRAVPGSGKTTYTNTIKTFFEQQNIDVAVHSTDEYFLTEEGLYQFELQKLYSFHIQNFNEFKSSLEKSVALVICDNTNLLPWETEPYTKIAREHGYKILCLNFEPRDIELHVKSQQITPEKPDAHQVPRIVLESMINAFHLYNALLDKLCTPDINLHLDYEWDIITNKKQVKANRASSHFDVDWVINIKPNEYRELLNSIGNKVLSICE